MTEDKIIQIIQYINSKSRWYIASWILGFIVLVIAIYIAANYTPILITVVKNDNITQSHAIYSASPGHTEEKIVVLGSIGFVERGTVSLKAVAGPYKTTRPLPTPSLIGFNSVTINLYRDRDTKKYSGDSLGCASYDKEVDRLLSYSCGKPVNLVHYSRPLENTGIWRNELVAQINDGTSPISSLKPFNGRLLGVHQHPDSDMEVRNLLFTIDKLGNKKRYNLPADIERNNLPGVSLVVDTASDSNHFLLVDNGTGGVTLGTLEGDDVTYTHSAAPKEYNSTFDVRICTLIELTARCYSGNGSGSSDHEHYDSHKEEDQINIIETIDFSNKNPVSKTYVIKGENPGFGSIYATTSGSLYLSSSNQLGFVDIHLVQLDKDSATTKPALINVSSASFGNGISYIQDNAIYKLDDEKNESYKVFSSKKLRLSSITPVGGDLFFNAFITDATDQKLHTYKILDGASAEEEGKRTVDLLPLHNDSSIIANDYMGNIVRVRVFASASPDNSRTKLIYNENEYSNNRNLIESRLTSLGITSDKYQITYTK